MATQIRDTNSSILPLITAHNALKKQIGAGASVHLDASEHGVGTVPAVAADLATSLTLLKWLLNVYESHRVDSAVGFAHSASDTTNKSASLDPAPIDLATALVVANHLKADFNAHRSQAGVHYNNDATVGGDIAAVNATDLASLETLLNEMRTDVPAHIALTVANGAPALRLIPA